MPSRRSLYGQPTELYASTGIVGTRRWLLPLVLTTALSVAFSQPGQDQAYRSTGHWPTVEIAVSYPAASHAQLHITATDTSRTLARIFVEISDHQSGFLDSLTLYDDGSHVDGHANDGVFGGTLSMWRDPLPIRVGIHTRTLNDSAIHTPDLLTSVLILGPVQAGIVVHSDNYNNDGVPNTGEEILFSFRVDNGSGFVLPDVQTVFAGDTIWLGSIEAYSSRSTNQEPFNLATSRYVRRSLPQWDRDTTVAIEFELLDGAGRWWVMTLPLTVVYHPPIAGVIPTHVTSGSHPGAFAVRVIKPDDLLAHSYEIRGHSANAAGVPAMSLRDLTTNTLLLDRVPLPDSNGHGVPVIHGFQVLRGRVNAHMGIDSCSFSGDIPVAAVPSAAMLFEHSSFDGSVGWDAPAHVFGNTIHRPVAGGDIVPVMVRFAQTNGPRAEDLVSADDQAASYAYRYLRAATVSPAQPSFESWIINQTSGYAYQDYRISVPVSAFDIGMNPPHRLAVGFLENNVQAGSVDGYYYPPRSDDTLDNVSGNGPREWLFIFQDDYTGSTARPELQQNIYVAPDVPIMYMCVWARREEAWPGGTSLTIMPHRMLNDADLWTFTPADLVAGVERPSDMPTVVSLSNHPNPFNPSTTIRFTIQRRAFVTLEVFDLLGRRVETIVQAALPAGAHDVVWNASASSSGMYVCRITAKDAAGGGQSRSIKLSLLR